MTYLHDWQTDNILVPSPVAHIPQTTTEEMSSPVKWSCFIDAAVFPDDNASGGAAIFCSDENQFIQAFSIHQPGRLLASHAEAVVLRSALQWFATNFHGRGIIYTDAQALTHALSSHHADYSEIGALIHECRLLLDSMPVVKVVWLRRNQNCAAHRLARSSLPFNLFMVWDFIPYCIRHLVE